MSNHQFSFYILIRDSGILSSTLLGSLINLFFIDQLINFLINYNSRNQLIYWSINLFLKWLNYSLIDQLMHNRSFNIWSINWYMIDHFIHDWSFYTWSIILYMIDHFIHDWSINTWSIILYMIDHLIHDRSINIWSINWYIL